MQEQSVELTREFLKAGCEILRIDHRARVTTTLAKFRYNFKYTPERCSYLFVRICNHPAIPDNYEPKHLLWTLYFLLTYATERRMCCIFQADRKTIRKYTWPTITAIARLAPRYVSLYSCASNFPPC